MPQELQRRFSSSTTIQPNQPSNPAQWSPEKRYLMDVSTRIDERGGTDQDFYNYLQHYETLPNNVKRQLTGRTVNPPREAPTTPSMVEGVAMNALQGLTFGFGDETVGGFLGVLTGQSWSEGVEEHRERLDAFANEHRVAALVGDIAGGFTGVGGIARLATRGARALGGVGRTLAGGAQRLAGPQRGLARRAAQASGFGAVGGAARGLGEGEGGLGERLDDAATGAVIGAVFGPAIVALGSGAVALARPVVRFASASASKAAAVIGANIPKAFTPATRARALISRRLAEDRVDPRLLREIAQTAHDGGQPIVFADILLEAKAYRTLALLDDAVKLRDPTLQRTLEEMQRLTARQSESGGRILGFMSERLLRGTKLGTMTLGDTQDALMGQARTNSAPLYERAHAAVAEVGETLREFLTGRGGFHKEWRTAYQRARGRVQSETITRGRELPAAVPALEEFIEQATRAERFVQQARRLGIPEEQARQQAAAQLGRTESRLPVRFLDYLKQELDEIVEPARVRLAGAETQGASRAGKKQIGEELASFLEVVDDQVPVYGEARRIFAGDAVLARVGDVGRDHYGSRVAAEQVRRALDALSSDAEKAMFRLGWLQGLTDDIHRLSGKNINFAERFFGGNPTGLANQRIQTIRALFPRADEADRIIASLHREARMFQTFARHGRSPSQTLEQAAEEVAERGVMPRGITVGTSVSPGRGAPGLFVRMLGSGINRARQPFLRDVSNEISSLYLRGASSPFEVDALIGSLIGTGSRSLQRATQFGAAGRLTAGQQAEQFSRDPLAPAVVGVQAGAQGLGALLNTLRRQ